MFSRSILFAAALLSASPSMMFASPAVEIARAEAAAPEERRKRRRSSLILNAPAHRRSKNAPTKRRLKANRLHIGRRVRRKHRRAA